MQLRRGELPKNSHRQRLATPRLAKALRRLFFSLSCAKNRAAGSAAMMPSARSSDSVDMKQFLTRFVAMAALVGVAGCAQIKKPATQPRAVPAGVRFDQVGSVTLFPGEPCTPQIMFNFRSAGSTVLLGAPKHETKILTEAAKSNRQVHISGRWRRGGQSNCSYVEVTSAEVTR